VNALEFASRNLQVARPRSSASTMASNSLRSCSTPRSLQHARLSQTSRLGFHLRQSASITCFSSLNSEYRNAAAANAIRLLIHCHGVPARHNCCAAARPAGPEPIRQPSAALLRCRSGIHPSSHPRSTIVFSICFMSRGWLIPRTHAPRMAQGRCVGELRELLSVQAPHGLFHAVIDQIVQSGM